MARRRCCSTTSRSAHRPARKFTGSWRAKPDGFAAPTADAARGRCYDDRMTRSDILSALRRQAQDFQALGATSLYLFGSTARDEARDDSDIDLFVDYDSERFSFVELIQMRERISHA